MSAEYSLKKIRDHHLGKVAYYTDEKNQRGILRHQAMADFLSERIKADESAVPVGTVFVGRGAWTLRGIRGQMDNLPDGNHPVYLHPPAQAAQVAQLNTSGLALALLEKDIGETVGAGPFQFGAPIAESVAQGESCTEERPCTPCFTDNGQCEDPKANWQATHPHSPDAADSGRTDEAFKTVLASLVAAVSLLRGGGKKAAASDTIFGMMLNDYEKAIEIGRAALAAQPQSAASPVGVPDAIDLPIEWRREGMIVAVDSATGQLLGCMGKSAWLAIAAAPSAPEGGEVSWIVALRKELLQSKITHSFTFTRDEVLQLLGATSRAPITREDVETFLAEYHKQVWSAAEGQVRGDTPRIAYDEAGEKLAETFLARFH